MKPCQGQQRNYEEKILESGSRCISSMKVCRVAKGGPRALQKADVRGSPNNALRPTHAWKMFALLSCAGKAVEAAGQVVVRNGMSIASMLGGKRVLRE